MFWRSFNHFRINQQFLHDLRYVDEGFEANVQSNRDAAKAPGRVNHNKAEKEKDKEVKDDGGDEPKVEEGENSVMEHIKQYIQN